jgi:multiple sugar transport system ATP-binding protein
LGQLKCGKYGSMAAISLSKLNKHYGSLFHAVKDVDLEIADKEFVALVGPSGCGKSTTLRMIAGLEDISSGDIRIGDRVVNHLPPRDRDIAMVFQNYALYQHMSVYDNLAFGLRNKKTPEAEIKAAIDRAAAMLGLHELLQRKPKQLSGGQQQRVALGRCIVRNPQVFLFDEPLSNLDAKLRAQMRIEIKRLHAAIPTTSVFVTHDQIEAMTLADRIVLMRDGLIEQQGAPLDLFERPVTRFVAGFLGSPQMNFIPCRTEIENDAPILRFKTGETLPLDQRRVKGFAEKERELVFGVRPEHFSPHDPGAFVRPGCARVTAHVEIVQPTGSRTFVQFPFGGTTVTAELPAHKVERPGTITELLIDLTRTILIEPESGRVIADAI